MSTHVRSGRWTLDDRAGSIYQGVDFEVGPGTASVRVELDYDRTAGVLDLGCADPDGFRGWSGGARPEFEITATDATPGYLPGPIGSGTWQVLFGLHRVAAAGMDWRVTITASALASHHDLGHSGAGISLRPESRRTDLPAPGGWQWLAGDLHSHTVHSDGALSVEDVARFAAARGLDYLAVTDHNTTSHHPYLADAGRAAGIVLIPGQELTTDRGHANAFGDIGRVEFREPPSRWVASVTDRGGLLSVNHPLAWDCAWRYRTTPHPPLAEVWHWSWFDRHDGGPLSWWLAGPADVVAIGGSDWHRQGNDAPPGSPTTWLLCQERSVDGVLDALRHGRACIAPGPADPVLLRHGDDLTAIGASGLLLGQPDGCRLPVRADQASWSGIACPAWLEQPDGTVMAIANG